MTQDNQQNSNDKTSETDLKAVAKDEAKWLKERKNRDNPDIDAPDLAAAPLGTDQEAGGAITTPSGSRKYS